VDSNPWVLPIVGFGSAGDDPAPPTENRTLSGRISLLPRQVSHSRILSLPISLSLSRLCSHLSSLNLTLSSLFLSSRLPLCSRVEEERRRDEEQRRKKEEKEEVLSGYNKREEILFFLMIKFSKISLDIFAQNLVAKFI
jgi:hypothetical protein